MQKGLTNITSETITALVDEDLRTTSIRQISMTNTHASTAVTVELYVEDRTNTVLVTTATLDEAESYTNARTGNAGGIDGTTATFNALTDVEVGDEVVFHEPRMITSIDADGSDPSVIRPERLVIEQSTSPITVTSLTSSTVCELSSIAIAPDDARVDFYRLERGYIVKTDIPGQTTLVIDNVPSINNKTSTLKLKTTSNSLSVVTPLTLNIT